MGQERADAHHLRLEVLQQAEVLHEAAARLPGRADHESRAGLEADRLEVAQAAQAVFQGELRRVQPGVVVRVRRLVPEEVAVCAGGKEPLVAGPAALADGERDGAVRERGADGGDDVRHSVVREVRVLPALEHEGAEAQFVPRLAAGEDLRLVQAVALRAGVAAPDAAVAAVVLAEVGELDQAADEDAAAVGAVAHGAGAGKEVVAVRRRALLQQRAELRIRQVPRPLEPVNIRLHACFSPFRREKTVRALTPGRLPGFPARAEISSAAALRATLTSAAQDSGSRFSIGNALPFQACGHGLSGENAKRARRCGARGTLAPP